MSDFCPFVVFGPSKSGTTWLQKSLDAHPDVRCHFQLPVFFFEDGGRQLAVRGGAVFSALRSPFRELFEGEEEARYWVRLRYFQQLRPLLEREVRELAARHVEAAHPDLLRETLLETYRALAERFLQDVSGKKRYGTKATSDLDFFFELYPKGKVVGIVRDGRDVAVSKRFHMQRRGAYYHGDEKNRWLYVLNHYRPTRLLVKVLQKRLGWFGESHYRTYGSDNMYFVPSALKKFAADWKLTVEYLLRHKQQRPAQVLVVRYEDLKKNQAGMLRRIFEFLEVPADDVVLQEVMAATDFKKLKKNSGGDSFFRKGASGDWKNYFSDKDKSLFKKIAGELLIELQYAEDLNW